MRRQIVLERDVAVRTFPEVVIVDPDLAIAIHAIKLDEDLFSLGSERDIEVLAIPTDAAGQRSTTCSSRRLFTELTFNAPVVRQIKLPPLRIIQADVLSTRNFTKMKAPALIKNHPFPRPRISEAERSCTQQQTKSGAYILFSVHYFDLCLCLGSGQYRER